MSLLILINKKMLDNIIDLDTLPFIQVVNGNTDYIDLVKPKDLVNDKGEYMYIARTALLFKSKLST